MNCHKVYMNQIHSSSLLCELSQMWKNQSLCDAIVRSGAVSVKAHRLVLVAACPMLKSMESASVGSHLEVRLASDIKQDAINTFLQYLYEGCMMLTEENYKDIEKIARILQVDSVIKCCSDFYKCLNSSSQYKYDYYDHVEFKHVRQTDMLKFSDKMAKRVTETKGPGGKRQRLQANLDTASVAISPKDDERPSIENVYKDPVRPYQIGTSCSTRNSNSTADIVEDGVHIHHVDKDLSRANTQVIDTASALSVSVASQIQTDTSVQVVNANKLETTSTTPIRTQESKVPTNPPLSGPYPSEMTEKSIPGPHTRGYTSPHLPPTKPFIVSSSPSMLPVGPVQFPTFVREVSSIAKTNGEVKDTGQRSITESQRNRTQSPDLSIVKKEPPSDVGYIDIRDEGTMILRQNDRDGEQLDEVSSDIEFEEPPLDDSYTGDPGGVSWVRGQTADDSPYTERASWHSVDTSGGPYSSKTEQNEDLKFDPSEMKFDGTDLKFYDEVLPGHRLIRIEGSKKACAYCDIQRLKTKSGWQIKSYFKCLACDIPLCKSDKECFLRYHELRLEQPNVPPKELHKKLKTKNKPLLLHNVTPSQMKSSSTASSTPPPVLTLEEESVTTGDIIRAHLSPSDFSPQNPAPALLTPYLYNTTNIPQLDRDSPEPSKLTTQTVRNGDKTENAKSQPHQETTPTERKSRKSVKTKPVQIVNNLIEDKLEEDSCDSMDYIEYELDDMDENQQISAVNQPEDDKTTGAEDTQSHGLSHIVIR